MEWCVTLPKEPVLIYRPSLRKACGGNRNAAKFLGYLLYRASIRDEAKIEAIYINEARKAQGQEADQDTSISIYRTQGQIIQEMDGEICTRTLRDESVPCLVELGYLKTEEIKAQKQYTVYTIYPDAIQQGIDHPELVPNFKTLAFYQEVQRVRKKLRTVAEGSEIIPNGQEKTPNGSEIIPQSRGKNSEPSRGSKRIPDAALEDVSQTPKSNKSNNKSKEEDTLAPVSSLSSDSQKDTPKPPRRRKATVDQSSILELDVSPVMPPLDAPWCAETLVQIVEAKKGARYSATTRKQEIQEATKLLTTVIYQGQPLSRTLFERAWDEMSKWAFWSERGIAPMIRHLCKDDKIRSILKQIKALPSVSIPSTQTPEKDGFRLLSQVEIMKLSLEERRDYAKKAAVWTQEHPDEAKRHFSRSA